MVTMTPEEGNVIKNLRDVQARLRAVGQEMHLPSYTPPRVIAVSKTFPAALITPLLERGVNDGGHRIFGENRVMEARDKWLPLKERYDAVELHMIGALQTNKACEAVELFDYIHSIDRPRLVDAVAKAQEKAGKRVKCFIQVNIGGEEQKSGVMPAELEALHAHAQDAGLDVVGLMCIPPVSDGDARHHPALYFALLAGYARRIGVSQLSMGMSGDYEIAAALGASFVRVGSAIFGKR